MLDTETLVGFSGIIPTIYRFSQGAKFTVNTEEPFLKSFIQAFHVVRFGEIDTDANHETRNLFDIHTRQFDLGLMHYDRET